MRQISYTSEHEYKDDCRDEQGDDGGFYRHFGSKEQLFIEAFEESLEELCDRLLSRIEQAQPGEELKVLVSHYLDIDHSNDVAGGCRVAALATEIARRPPKARATFMRILKNYIAQVAKYARNANGKYGSYSPAWLER